MKLATECNCHIQNSNNFTYVVRKKKESRSFYCDQLPKGMTKQQCTPRVLNVMIYDFPKYTKRHDSHPTKSGTSAANSTNLR